MLNLCNLMGNKFINPVVSRIHRQQNRAK